jgi:CDP-glucose 4,6-dehydratase
LWLAQLGAQVTGYALPPLTEPSLFVDAGVAGGLTHIVADIRDGAALRAALAQAQPDFIFHLAAQPLVLESYAAPEDTFAINVGGSIALMEAIRHTGTRAAVVMVTTDKVYRNCESGRPYREDDPLGGHDPYSASKAAMEIAVASWRDSFFPPRAAARHGVRIATARAGNVIGGGDWSANRIVPDLARALIANAVPKLRHPAALRPWQHVLEPLAGYLVAAEHLAAAPQAGAAWNFGPDADSEVNVATVACRVCGLWGGGIRPVEQESAARGAESRMLTLDSTKARRELGWRPRWGLDRALTETVRWYQAWRGNQNMKTFSLGQIADYTGAAQSLPDEAKEVA